MQKYSVFFPWNGSSIIEEKYKDNNFYYIDYKNNSKKSIIFFQVMVYIIRIQKMNLFVKLLKKIDMNGNLSQNHGLLKKSLKGLFSFGIFISNGMLKVLMSVFVI